MVVVRKRSVGLLQDLGRPHAQGRRGSDFFGVAKQPSAKGSRNENVRDMGLRVGKKRGHERPVLGLVEIRPGPTNRGAVALEAHEMRFEKLRPGCTPMMPTPILPLGIANPSMRR